MANTKQVQAIRDLVKPEDTAAWVSELWTKWNNQRTGKLSDWEEIDKYLFATDTSTTSNKDLPWTHSTTTPKLTQIRDNLHSNYISSLFPNDKWLTWVAYDKASAKKEKARTITAYMENKGREGGLRETVSHLLYDYIDKGVAFAMPTFEARYNNKPTEKIAAFVGPKAVRISPYDIVFNPTAVDFKSTPKIIRSYQTLGSLRKLAADNPEMKFWDEVVNRRKDIMVKGGGFGKEEWIKAQQYSVDGFGSLYEYYGSEVVEILEFYGDYYDSKTDTFYPNQMITVVDRSYVARTVPIPTYSGEAPIRMAGWRLRPDNLWAMGPLDNLVGMQYLLDHYSNMVSNALDLKVMPPKKIIGDVEQFEWKPNAEIHIDENGDVTEMAQQFGDVYTALQYVEQIEAKMELYAGAPREAMGIRTPGEKTAFEVQRLENAAGRIFQEKITQFELFLEEVLNDMLEEAHRNFPITDMLSIFDNDIGVRQFKEITKEDITANGVLRPIGARHFAQQAQELQNLVGVFQSPMAQVLAPHTSGLGLSEFIKDVVNLKGYEVFAPYVAIAEQQELQSIANNAQEENIMQEQTSPEQLASEQLMRQQQGQGAPNENQNPSQP